MNTDMLELIASYAQIAEAIAVIFSLIYVAFQFKLSIRSTTGATYQSNVVLMAEIEARISQDESLATLYKKGVEGTLELSDIEWIRFNEMISSLMNLHENLFYQKQKGLLEKHMWKGWSNHLINFLKNPGVRLWWDKNNCYYSKSFRCYISGRL